MTTQLLTDVGAYLNTVYADSYSGKFALGTNLFLSLLPESPDTCMGVFENAGVAPVYTFGATSVTRPELQVIIRNSSYETGRSDSPGWRYTGRRISCSTWLGTPRPL